MKKTKLTRELSKKYGIKYKRCAGCKKLVPYSFRFLGAAPIIGKQAGSNLVAIYSDRSYVFDSQGNHSLSKIIICPKCRKRNFDHDKPITKIGIILDAMRAVK